MRRHHVRTLAAAAVALLCAAEATALAAPWDASGIDWSKAPASAPDSAFAPPKPRRLKLKNGISLLVVENHRLPLVSMRLVVLDAGSAQDPAGRGGLAALTGDLLDESAGGLSALEIDERQSQLGATIDVTVGFESATVSVDTMSRTLEPTLDLLVKIVTAPGFDDKESARVHADRLTDLKLLPDRPRELAMILLHAVLYGRGSPYGHNGDGTIAEVEKLGPADARAFYTERWQPSRMTLVVVGDVDAIALRDRLDATLGAWKPKGGKKPAKVAATPQKRAAAIYLVDRPGAEQADVRLGIISVDRKDARDPAVEVMATVLGGTFTSRLNRRLREELGWTYGVSATPVRLVAGSLVLVSTALVTPHAVEGVKEIVTILHGVRDAAVPEDELRKAKLNRQRDLPSSFASNDEAAAAFAWLVRMGLPDDWYAGYAKRIGKVTAKDVQKVAKTLLAEGKLTIVVVGDASVIRAGLEGLGLGALEVVPVADLL